MDSILEGAITGIQNYGWQVLYASVFCLALELSLPANHYSLRSRVRAAGFWSIYIIITATSFAFFNVLWATLELKPFFRINLSWLTNLGNSLAENSGVDDGGDCSYRCR